MPDYLQTLSTGEQKWVAFGQGFGHTSEQLGQKEFALFVQDTWKAKPNLTVNYGLRYEIQIEPRPGAPNAELPGSDFIPSDWEQIGPRLGVAWDRVEGLAKLGDASEAQILAYLAAHEVGHLLLGPGAHTSGGIMRPGWSRVDMRPAAWGRLAFEPWQGERIRSAMLTRTAASPR